MNRGHEVLLLLLLHGGVGKVLGGLLILIQVLFEQGDLLYMCLEQFFKACCS